MKHGIFLIVLAIILTVGCSEERAKVSGYKENIETENNTENGNRISSEIIAFPSDSTWQTKNGTIWQQMLPETQVGALIGIMIAKDMIFLDFPYLNVVAQYNPQLNADGFLHLSGTINSQNGSMEYKSIMISGSGIIIMYTPKVTDLIQLFPIDIEFGFNRNNPQLLEAPRTLEGPRLEFMYLDDGIKGINASSELVEISEGSQVVYSTSRLKNRIAAVVDEGEGLVHYRNFILCWAEGVPGPGIGEYLDISFTRPSDRLIVLNGYVDLIKRELYRQNNRLRTVKITSENPAFETEYTFEDIVKFHEIPLPAATESVRLVIQSVYPGSLFDDTCVSAIMLPQQRLRSEEEERKAIIDLLKSRGYDVE